MQSIYDSHVPSLVLKLRGEGKKLCLATYAIKNGDEKNLLTRYNEKVAYPLYHNFFGVKAKGVLRSDPRG